MQLGTRKSIFKVSIALVAMALVAAACGGDDEPTATTAASGGETTAAAPELTPVSVRLNVNATGTHAPFVLARDKGWYAEEGLEVTFGEGGGSDVAVATIDAGDDDIGIASFDAVAVLRPEGANVKVVGAWESRSPLAIITLADSPIKEASDLEGAQVTMDQGDFAMFEAFAARAGIDADAVELVIMSEEAQAPALAEGQIDGILGWTTYHSPQLVEITGDVAAVLWSDYNFDLMNLTIIASDDRIENDPETVCGFVRASYRGLEYSMENPDEAIEALMGEFANLNQEIMLGQLVNMFELVGTPNTEGQPMGWVAEADVAGAIEVLSDAGDELDVEAADLFDNLCFDS